MNVRHEDDVCRLFPYTFENKALTWFFSLEEDSITSWREFETAFIENSREYKTPTTLVPDLLRIKMEAKEKIKYFNQRFLTLMKIIPQASNPGEDVSIEFYTSALPVSITMFVNYAEKISLEEFFKESIKVEKAMLILKGNPGDESSK
jgi:hypothetical protein